MRREIFEKLFKLEIDEVLARRVELYRQFENTPKDADVIEELTGLNEYLNARKGMGLQCGSYDAPATRTDLIRQLRTALHLAESPSPENEVVEFEIGSTDFSFDFSEG